jgi:hypothetical protein
MIKYLALLMILPALAACNNAYDLFYDEVPHSSQLAPVTDDPRLMTGGNPRQVALAMYREGYALIGVSEFVGPAVPPAVALQQAKKVGAAIVVVTGKYRSTASRPTNTSANSGIDSVAAGNLAFGTESAMVTSNGRYRYAQVGLFFAPLLCAVAASRTRYLV